MPEEPRLGAGGLLERRSIATVALGVQIVGLQYNDDLNVNFIPVADADRAPATTALVSGRVCRATRRST